MRPWTGAGGTRAAGARDAEPDVSSSWSSSLLAVSEGKGCPKRSVPDAVPPDFRFSHLRRSPTDAHESSDGGLGREAQGREGQDRKSTRLNSSHVSESRMPS